MGIPQGPIRSSGTQPKHISNLQHFILDILQSTSNFQYLAGCSFREPGCDPLLRFNVVFLCFLN